MSFATYLAMSNTNTKQIKIDLPPLLPDAADTFENKAIESLVKAKIDNIGPYKLEFISVNSYDKEFREAIRSDQKLLPLVFSTMCVFSSLVYYKRDKVGSSCLFLGLGAIATCCFSLLMSFGLMFIVGVPFTNLSFMLPFIIMGIGIDDAFIITGSYSRTDTSISSVDRILITVKDCGLSIFVTTVTTSLAFCLCLMSKIPAVRDFSMYATLSVMVDFLFQITFFISLIKVNDERIEHRRYDCIPCCAREGEEEEEDESTARRSGDALNIRLMRAFSLNIVAAPKSIKIAIIFGM